MVKRLFAIFHTELRSVHQAAFLLGLATIASALLGLLRNRFLTSRFVAADLDIYLAAFRVPDFLYALSLFLVASTAIIPIFLEKLDKEGSDEGTYLMSSLFTLLLFILIPVLGVAYMIMPFLARNLLPGFGAEPVQRVVDLSRILLLSPLLLGLSNLTSSTIQAYRRFYIYALSPLFYNLGIIMGIFYLAPRFGLAGVGWGVVLGALMHFLIQVPSLVRLGSLPSLTMRISPDVRRVLLLSFPRAFGLAAGQLTYIAITAIASTIGVGAITVYSLSHDMQSIPLSVIGLSYSIAAFPMMAQMMLNKERKIFFEHLASGIRHIIFWTLPVAILFIVLRAQIIRSIYGAGVFGWVDTRLTAASLALFALSIVAQSLVALFVRAFHAMGKTKMPLIINIICMLATIGLAFLFVQLLKSSPETALVFGRILRVEDVPNMAVLGLPLAFSVGSLLNALVLGVGLGMVDGEFRKQNIMRSFWEVLTASVSMGVVTYASLNLFARFFDLERFWGIFLQGFCAGIVGIIVAFLFLKFRRNQEFLEVYEAARRRFWKEEVVAPEPERL